MVEIRRGIEDRLKCTGGRDIPVENRQNEVEQLISENAFKSHRKKRKLKI